MNHRTNRVKKIEQTPHTRHALIDHRVRVISARDLDLRTAALSPSCPDMEQRLSARHSWEFLDEGRSTFYARLNPKDPSYDPLFPRPIPSSTTGRGPRRWKLGAIIDWLRLCELTASGV